MIRTLVARTVALLMFLLLMNGAQGSEYEPDSVDNILHAPMATTRDSFIEAGLENGRFEEAFEAGAYRWFLTMMGGSWAKNKADSFWDEVKQNPDPYNEFGNNLTMWQASIEGDLATVTEQIEEYEQGGTTVLEFEQLLFASQFAVQAESSLILARKTLDSSKQNPESYFDTSIGRETVSYPIGNADVFVAASAEVLDHLSPQEDAPLFPLTSLEKAMEENQAPPANWILPERGRAHQLERHLLLFESSLMETEFGDRDVKDSLNQLYDLLDFLKLHGFSGARLEFVARDVAWWMEQPEDDGSSPVHQDLEKRVQVAVEAIHYEAELLLDAMEQGQDNGVDGQGSSDRLVLIPVSMTFWVGIVIGTIAVAGALGVVLYRRNRHIERDGENVRIWQRRTSSDKKYWLFALMAAVVVANIWVFPGVDGTPVPDHPFPEPYLLATGNGVSWGATVHTTTDGTVHAAWGECAEPVEKGCKEGEVELRYRTYNPGEESWSEAITLAAPPGQDAYLPVVSNSSRGIVVAWLEGIAVDNRNQPPTEHPAELWICNVTNGECEDRERISGMDAGVESAAMAVGPEGLLRAVWSEARDQEGYVVFRQETDDGWAEPVEFPDGGYDQRQPEVAVSPDGRSHLVWLARPPTHLIHEPYHRVIHHVVVGPDNSVTNDVDYASQHVLVNHGAAVVVHEETLHLVYGTEQGLFHRSWKDDEWNDAYNVSQNQRNIMRPDLVSTPDGVIAVWMEYASQDPGFSLHMAELVDDFWLQPSTVLDTPYRALDSPSLSRGPDDLYHLAWAGRTSREDPARVQYRTLSVEGSQEVDGPNLRIEQPKDGTWHRSDPIEMQVRVELHAPLDREHTEWTVNGATLDYLVSSGTLTATIEGLDEGQHDVELVVVDQAGNEESTSWAFHIDRTRPVFDAVVVDEDDDKIDGWNGGPVWIRGTVESDDGAPGYLEAQATLTTNGSPVRLDPSIDKSWTRIPRETGLSIPEGYLLEIVVRARDEAGNLAIGDTVIAGWDTSTPELNVSAPDWVASSTIGIPVRTSEEYLGAPVQVEADLSVTDDLNKTVSTNVTVEDSKGGLLEFADVQDGIYELTLSRVNDEAGNVLDDPPGPWRIGVDTLAPSLNIHASETSMLIEVEDGGSGVVLLRTTSEGRTVAETVGEEGSDSLELEIDASDLDESVRIQAMDAAGNEVKKILHPDGRIEDDVANDESIEDDNSSSSISSDNSGIDDPSGHREFLPEPPSSLIITLVALVFWGLARTRRKKT